MIVKLIIPIIDTDSNSFEYEKELTDEEYANMLQNHIEDTEKNMNIFFKNMANNTHNVYKKTPNIEENNVEYVDYKFIEYEAEALLLNKLNENINEDFLKKYSESQHKFIMYFNINPNSLKGDASSEIKEWINESDNIINDNEITDRIKLLTLPKRNFKIVTEQNTYSIVNCQILQNLANDKYPYYFAIMVEKITKL